MSRVKNVETVENGGEQRMIPQVQVRLVQVVERKQRPKPQSRPRGGISVPLVSAFAGPSLTSRIDRARFKFQISNFNPGLSSSFSPSATAPPPSLPTPFFFILCYISLFFVVHTPFILFLSLPPPSLSLSLSFPHTPTSHPSATQTRVLPPGRIPSLSGRC